MVDQPPVVASRVDGYWLMGVLSDEDVLQENSSMQFLELRSTGPDDSGNDIFEMLDVCPGGSVLATGYVTPDGEVYVDSTDPDEEDPVQFAEFTGNNEFRSLDAGVEDQLVARRVQEPDCGTLNAYDITTGTSLHSLNFNNDSILLGASQSCADLTGGVQHLCEAEGDALPLGHEEEKPNDDPDTQCQNPDGSARDCPDSPDSSHAGLVECSVQNWTETRQFSTQDLVALLDIDAIYPGALLQGNSFAGGNFTPITIPRSGGGFIIEGLSLGGSPKFEVDEIRRSNVIGATQTLLSTTDILATAAQADFDVKQAYSAEQFALSIGINASVEGYPANISGKLNVSSDSFENTVVAQFTQVYYEISYDTPERSFSVFRDGEAFEDPDNQIGDGNPPLYVSSVKYGRQILFFLRSSYGYELVKAALEGAFSGDGATAKASAELDYRSIVQNSSVSYVVRGGPASTSLGPIDSASPEEMYDAIKKVIADSKAADFSLSSPGVPIAYTLKYLADNKTAMTSYSSTYDRRDCRVYPPHDFEYKLRVKNSSYHGWVNLDKRDTFGGDGVIAGPYTNKVSTTLDLDDFVADNQDHTLILSNYSTCGVALNYGIASGNWDLYVDGARRFSDSFYRNIAQCSVRYLTHPAGLQYEARIQINRATGKVNVISVDK